MMWWRGREPWFVFTKETNGTMWATHCPITIRKLVVGYVLDIQLMQLFLEFWKQHLLINRLLFYSNFRSTPWLGRAKQIWRKYSLLKPRSHLLLLPPRANPWRISGSCRVNNNSMLFCCSTKTGQSTTGNLLLSLCLMKCKYAPKPCNCPLNSLFHMQNRNRA